MKCLWENVSLFERLVAEYAGSKFAVAVDSCTNALFLSMQYCKRIMTVDHLVIPERTYISVPMQAIHCGYKISFKDIDWSGIYKLNPLPVIDSAQRFTSGMYVDGTLQCLSFHSKKILSIGRGGMILTDDRDCYNWLKRSRYDGRSSIYYNEINNKTVPEIGWHMYMTPEEAIRGVEQLYKTSKFNHDGGKSSDYKVNLSKLKCFQNRT